MGHYAEGAFLSNEQVSELSYRSGQEAIHSSLTGTGYDLALFRLRA